LVWFWFYKPETEKQNRTKINNRAKPEKTKLNRKKRAKQQKNEPIG
jgi:hypothetical protein